MCIKCGLVHAFTEELELEPLTAKQFGELPESVRQELTILLMRHQALS